MNKYTLREACNMVSIQTRNLTLCAIMVASWERVLLASPLQLSIVIMEVWILVLLLLEV